MKDIVKENYAKILQEIEGKDVTVLPVVKGRSSADFDALRAVGLMTVGENRAQEFMRHYDEQQGKGYKWHFIGQLQSNKVKYVLGKCDLIHSLDRISLAREIDRLSGQRGLITECLIEVNVGDEGSKGGLPPCQDVIEDFIRDIGEFKNIKIRGIMAVMPYLDSDEEIEPYYEKLAELYGSLKDRYNFDILSAGMSDDYKIAVKYGANLIRLGRVLFESR